MFNNLQYRHTCIALPVVRKTTLLKQGDYHPTIGPPFIYELFTLQQVIVILNKIISHLVGQSEPRFQFTLSKSRARLNPAVKATDDDYAEIPKKIPWNFPSSDEDEEVSERPRHKKVPTAVVRIQHEESSTSDEDEKPPPPPKLWKSLELTNGNCQGEVLQRQGSRDSGIKESKSQTSIKQDDITIEYSALERVDSRKGSLLGAEDQEFKGSPTFSHSSGFEEHEENLDTLSMQSDNSLKAITDYEQSSTCVDMDQLSLDSWGKRPKRIVETHETHEIVPAENNEDDIVERIIETQTITEKLDEKHTFKDYSSEDYPKYMDDDDEFVSHIFTLGRTLEKRSKKKKDFAFVENPFSVPDPAIETMPLEKKTVKQKITTLVKKKKAKEDENVYAEVTLSHSNSLNQDIGEDNEDDTYDHMNDLVHTQLMDWSEGNEAGGTEHRNCQPSTLKDANGLLYSSVENNYFTQPAIADSKATVKPEKKSIFKGIKKLLKKKDKNSDACRAEPSVLDDDYQEFVP